MCRDLRVYHSETDLRTSFHLSRWEHLARPFCSLTNCQSKTFHLANSSCPDLKFHFGGILPRNNFRQQMLVDLLLLSFPRCTDHHIWRHLANSQFLARAICHQAIDLRSRLRLHVSRSLCLLPYRLPTLLHRRHHRHVPACPNHLLYHFATFHRNASHPARVMFLSHRAYRWATSPCKLRHF
jgi:hypothetical protein